MKKIFVLTGKRGGFGAMKPMLRLMRDEPTIDLQLVVTDQHLSHAFGNTVEEVEKEFKCSAKVDLQQEGGTPLNRAQALGVCVTKMSQVLSDLKPDICVLYGDRGEVLASALVATTLGIPIAHIQGGDLSGSVDEQMRHAITKLAHIHFPSTEESGTRLKKMGEDPSSVHIVGDNHIDLLVAGEYANRSEVMQRLGIVDGRPTIIILQHPETTDPDASLAQMDETFKAVSGIDAQYIVIYPCSDAGYEGIVDSIEQNTFESKFKVFKNVDAHIFWGLLKIASALVGNSSSGIIEAPTFKLPVVNIGRRQDNRLRSENVIDVPHEKNAIKEAIEKALNDSSFRDKVSECSQIYGDGEAGLRIVDVLKNMEIKKDLFVKRMMY
jgi:GDP/UDP-N,N'-diacetylbacillosamine 2-epimerase (hydrolysing)